MAQDLSEKEGFADAVNTISRFLANEQISDLHTCPPVDCIVICVSALVFQGERLFRALETRPSLAKSLVLVGGIGHSTKLLYEAIGRHDKYKYLRDDIEGLPEARVMETILKRHFDLKKIQFEGCQILIEDKSTNCGSNAIETRKVLEDANVPSPASVLLIQDPTMSLRSPASFQKTYEDHVNPPRFLCCPFFVPTVLSSPSGLQFANDIPHDWLWSTDRFLELILGEIPRLRDDKQGYGPTGKGFIPHVDIPDQVERSWRLLNTHAEENTSGRTF
ncbi:hypothetical protein M409DRAFT_70812 [Zasmidium cellare ATCC 36951]|uniref:DUF218 domain-containing protein n=1 Tax=Zasmidium cellare ATCC 36951 TaxID=1080233 RepID=A0A6A6C218_ZASCE|nr:uncharacterized protein M409DRAFT_70812 [Zasmidium cellare ATCC 36951]KAF2159759.1 hypothetical protein M409DRAFT_70812 [Zasmidium cellare ATCC 36951]